MNLKEAVENLNKQFCVITLESNSELNDASREVIRAFRVFHGKAFLVKINNYTITEWDGKSLVCNFDADAVVSSRDPELVDLLSAYESNENFSKNREYIQAIFDRIEVLNGEVLYWS